MILVGNIYNTDVDRYCHLEEVIVCNVSSGVSKWRLLYGYCHAFVAAVLFGYS